jgi:hypothetical protein
MAPQASVLERSANVEPRDKDLQARIRAEYREMPGLKLTLAQASRLFNVDSARCERALARLVAAGALRVDEGSFLLTQPRGHLR